MENNESFSIEMPLDSSFGFKPSPDLIAFDLCRAYPVPGGNLLLHNARNGKRTVVKPEVFSALALCDRFKTLEAHIERIIEQLPGMQGQKASIRDVLEGLLESGIMVSATTVCDDYRKSAGKSVQERGAPAPVVAIITWERPQALQRLLESIVANCVSGKFHRLYVIDDSRKPENISSNQALVEKFSKDIQAPLVYFGQREQQSLLSGLIGELPGHEPAIRFLADQSAWRDHWTAGLSRNLALLVSCGRRLVMIDDDVLCDLHEPPMTNSGISFSDGAREADFFGGEEDWSGLRRPADPVDRHMQCLGLTFSEALDILGKNHLKPAGLENASVLEISELTPQSPVLVTECGSLGCPGTGDNTWLPDLPPVSLDRLLASQQKTTHSLTTRKVWSGRSHPHFAPRPNMSQITGFDNRQSLPPYLPVMRGQDRLFGFMLDFIFPAAVTLDYPWAVPHLPLPERKWTAKDLNFTPKASFPQFFFTKILEQKSSCLAAAPAERLGYLSAWLKDLAATRADVLTGLYRHARLHDDSERLQHLNTLLANAENTPVDWQNYLRNGISQLTADLDRVSREDFTVSGWPETLQGDALIGFWKETWAGFASALEAWPEIRAAAGKLVADGAL